MDLTRDLGGLPTNAVVDCLFQPPDIRDAVGAVDALGVKECTILLATVIDLLDMASAETDLE
jgi:hypothetical protein